MKKFIKYSLLIGLALNLLSCTDDTSKDVQLKTDATGTTALKSYEYTRFDYNRDIKVNPNAVKTGVTVTSVEIYYNAESDDAKAPVLGNKIIDAAKVSDNVFTFNSSKLGDFDDFGDDKKGTTGSFRLAIVTKYSDGFVETTAHKIEIQKGIRWMQPGKKDVIIDNSGVTSVKIADETTKYIKYGTYVRDTLAPMERIAIEWKYSDATDFTPIRDGHKSMDSINVAEHIKVTGILAGKKVVYRFIAHTGVLNSKGDEITDAIETAIEVKDQVFGDSSTGELAKEGAKIQYSLSKGLNFPTSNEKDAEIKYSTKFGFAKVVQVPHTVIDGVNINEIEGFVKVATPASYFSNTNLFTAETDYAAGTKVTDITDLVIGDVLIYKILRSSANLGTADEPRYVALIYYGLIEVVSQESGSAASDISFSFKHKEGTIAREVK